MYVYIYYVKTIGTISSQLSSSCHGNREEREVEVLSVLAAWRRFGDLGFVTYSFSRKAPRVFRLSTKVILPNLTDKLKASQQCQQMLHENKLQMIVTLSSLSPSLLSFPICMCPFKLSFSYLHTSLLPFLSVPSLLSFSIFPILPNLF